MNQTKKRIVVAVGLLFSTSVFAAMECVPTFTLQEVRQQIENTQRAIMEGKSNNDVFVRIGQMENTIKEALLGGDWGPIVQGDAQRILNKVPVQRTSQGQALPPSQSIVGLKQLMETTKVSSVPEALAHIAAAEHGQAIADKALAVEALNIDSWAKLYERISQSKNSVDNIHAQISTESAKFFDQKMEKHLYTDYISHVAEYASPDASTDRINESPAGLSKALTPMPILSLGTEMEADDNSTSLYSMKHAALLTDVLVGVESSTVGNDDSMGNNTELAFARLKNFARKQLSRISVYQTFDPKIQSVLNQEYVAFAQSPSDADFKNAVNKSSEYWLGVISKQMQGMVLSSIESRRLQMETNRLLGIILATNIDTYNSSLGGQINMSTQGTGMVNGN